MQAVLKEKKDDKRKNVTLLLRFILGFVILVGLDQWTKGLAVAHLKENFPI